MKRFLPAVIVFLLLTVMLIIFNFRSVKSEWIGPIYIRADGSVDPPEAPIITDDKVMYFLTDNIMMSSGDGIVVERDNIIIDGSCNTLIGCECEYTGILIHSRNVTIKNMNVKEFYSGIYIDNSSNNLIVNCTAYGSMHGIYVYGSSKNSIVNCTTYNTGYDGITIVHSLKNSIVNCTTYNNGYDSIVIAYSSNNSVTNSIAFNSDIGITVRSSSSVSIANCITYNNYMGILVEDLSYNITINNCTARANSFGIYLDYSSKNIITNCTVNGNTWGIELYYNSDNNVINNCLVYDNSYGISVRVSSNNLIYNNYFNNLNNFYLSYSPYNKWNITKTFGKNVIGGPYLGGNYWSDYEGGDVDGDELGDTEVPYGPGDHLPLTALTLSLRTKDWAGDILPFCNVTIEHMGSRCKVSDSNGWANFTNTVSGAYTITVRWQGSKVNQTSVSINSDITMNIRCHVWRLTINAKDNSGNLLESSNMQMYIIFPNGTQVNLKNVNSVTWRAQNGTYYFAVKWQGNWVYGDPPTALDVDNETLDLICKVYRLSFKFNDIRESSLYMDPSQILIHAPNGTLITLKSYSILAQNGTWVIKQILWNGNNIKPDTNLSCILTSDYEWNINCRVYNLSFTFKNSDGTANLSPAPSCITLLCPNGTSVIVSSYSNIRLQNGSYTITHITWNGVNVVPSPHPFISLTSDFILEIRCLVYDLKFKVSSLYGLPVQGAIVMITLPNGTVVTAQTDNEGIATFPQVPHGTFNGTISYLGQTRPISGYVAQASVSPIAIKDLISIPEILSIIFPITVICAIFVWRRKHKVACAAR